MQMLKHINFQIGVAPTAAGLTDVNGAGVDLQGYEGCLFILGFGTITVNGVQGLKAQASDDDGSGDAYSDLAGTLVAAADTDDDKLVVLDVHKPAKRWIRPVVERATANSVIDLVIAIPYGAMKKPTVTHADVANSEIHASPAEGTA